VIPLIVNSCSKLPTIQPTPAIPEGKRVVYEDLKRLYSVCRGSGQLVSSGSLSGQLNFLFTSKGDSTYLQFKDLLGRRTIFMQIFANNVEVWDMLQNRRYTRDKIVMKFPFLKTFKPIDLTRILWGVVPDLEKSPPELEQELQHEEFQVEFKAEQTPYGYLVSKVIFKTNSGQSKIEIIINRREFGAAYVNLIHNIPGSIPMD